MYKQQFQALGLATLTCLGLGMTNPLAHAASPFGQKDVDQTKYAVIAMPLARGGYKLLVVEQVSDKRDCWAENGTAPTVIDPLLVTFDFTGICGRSTDSNGYSIRVEQQDLGIEYRLSIEQQGGELLLTGVHNRGSGGGKMVIGRTYGMVPGSFMKIYLEPNWRLTRRTFEDRTLGHVYFTSDSKQAAFNPSTPRPTLQPLITEDQTGGAPPQPAEISPLDTTVPSQPPTVTPETSPASTISNPQALVIDSSIDQRLNRSNPPRRFTR